MKPAPRRAWYLASAATLTTGALLGACSLAVDFAECRNDADCLTKTGEQWNCRDSRCVEPPGTTGAATTTTQPPTTGDTSTTVTPTSSTGDDLTTGSVTVTTGTGEETTTDPGSSSDTGTPTCTLHSECEAALGDGYLCIDGDCISALTDECQKFVWPSQGSHDKVVLLGAIVPTSPPYDVITVPLQNGVQLAIEDYNRTTDLPGGHRIAWIACDDAGSAVKAIAAAKHLTGTLKVPAIVGPIFSEQVIAVAQAVTIPAGTFLITPAATSKAITTLDDDGLVWRPISSDVYQANALADRVLQLDPNSTRVALLGKADAYGKGIISDVTKRLSKLLGAGFKTFEYPDPAGLTQDQLANEYSAVLGPAWVPKGMHPDTFLFAGTSEVAFFVAGIMNLWNSEGMLVPAPRMIVTHGAVPGLEGMVKSAASDADKITLIENLEGVAPDVLDPDNFASFNVRYKLRFNDTDAITFSSLAYDAALVTIFAMSAIPQGEAVTGAAIAGNVGKLVGGNGPKVSFGDVDGTELLFIKKAHNALVSGGTVDLKGVSGELNFDLTTGEVRTNVIGWGLEPKDMMNPTVPVLTPLRVYVLDPVPSEVGTWMNLP